MDSRLVDLDADTGGGVPSDGSVMLVPGQVDVESLAASHIWHGSGRWSLRDVKRVADQDGDGLADALVWVELDDFSSIQVLLVQGPLRRDLVVADRVREPIDLEGRFTGVVDLNLDGVGDRSRYDEGTGELRITWGPVSRWGEAAPDVVFTPPLCPGGHTHTRHFDTPQVIHDVTGDGLHELILGARYRCSGEWIVMPMPLTGRIDGSSISKVHRGHWPELQVVPDQSGDGRPDLLDWDVTHQQWTIVASPVILERGEVVGERRPIQGMPTSVDLTGDGIGERFALDDQGFHLVDGSSEAEVLPWGWAPWVDRWFGGFVEDGVGAALVTQYAVPHEIWVIDLGEATLAR